MSSVGRRLALSMVALLIISGALGACGGSGTRQARATSACGLLVAHWNGQARSLCTPAGKLGFAPETEVNLKVGEEVTLTTPPRGVPILAAVRSTNPEVLSLRPTASVLARFRALGRGTTDVLGQSRDCLSSPDGRVVVECAVMRVAVTT